jgi:hypothetical protein
MTFEQFKNELDETIREELTNTDLTTSNPDQLLKTAALVKALDLINAPTSLIDDNPDVDSADRARSAAYLTQALEQLYSKTRKPIPYTALVVGSSHMVATWAANNQPTAIVRNIDTTTNRETNQWDISTVEPIRFGNKVCCIIPKDQNISPIINGRVVGVGSTANTQVSVRRSGVECRNDMNSLEMFSNRFLSIRSPVWWVQEYVGYPFKELDLLAYSGATIEAHLEMLTSFEAPDEKYGFAFYQGGTNNINMLHTVSQMKVTYNGIFAKLKEAAEVVVIQSLTNFGYTAAKIETMQILNAWLQQRCQEEGFIWADWNEATYVDGSTTLTFTDGTASQIIQGWAKISADNYHLSHPAACAIGRSVIVPKIKQYLPKKVDWTPAAHNKYNIYNRISIAADPLLAEALVDDTHLPWRLTYGITQDPLPTLELRSLNGVEAGTPGSHNALVVTPHVSAYYLPVDFSTSGANSETMPGIQNYINKFATNEDEFCYAVDLLIPAGKRIRTFELIIRSSAVENALGEPRSGSGAMYNNIGYGNDLEDTWITVYSPWIKLRPFVSVGNGILVRFLSHYLSAWTGDNGIVQWGFANPRLLCKHEVAG